MKGARKKGTFLRFYNNRVKILLNLSAGMHYFDDLKITLTVKAMTKHVKAFWVAAILVCLWLGPASNGFAQAMPEVLEEGTLSEQYDYLHQRTNIYNNFRAIREDMFQKIRRNSLDSLRVAKSAILELNTQIGNQNQAQQSLQNELSQALSERDTAVRERDSLFLFGIAMNKTFYNLLLWTIIIGLLILLIIIFILFKRSHTITSQRTQELNELRLEYEEYRKTSRERFEQQSIDHFNEIKRLKGI